ncbi:hypothetical protein [Symbiopectobacterium sp. RP]|uniref:hypothetical protein n=1 Tax=Symbiopectobacterium sp. RP TaxID=3248553 RepID=UPI003D27CC02
MITANALICGKKIQLIVIKIMSLGYTDLGSILCPNLSSDWISLSLVHHYNQSLVGN